VVISSLDREEESLDVILLTLSLYLLVILFSACLETEMYLSDVSVLEMCRPLSLIKKGTRWFP
jgi:hypothetical protein